MAELAAQALRDAGVAIASMWPCHCMVGPGRRPGIRAITLGEPANSSSRTTSSTPASRSACTLLIGMP